MPDITDNQVERITGHLKKLSIDRRRRLVKDAYQFGFAAYKRGPAGRPTAVRKELKATQAAIARVADHFEALSNQSWIMLGIAEEHEKDALIKPLQRIGRRLESAIEVASERVAETKDWKGGRARDDRVFSCVYALATVFTRQGLGPITHSVSGFDGSITSDFDRFVTACFREFYPEGDVPHQAIERAIREVRDQYPSRERRQKVRRRT